MTFQGFFRDTQTTKIGNIKRIPNIDCKNNHFLIFLLKNFTRLFCKFYPPVL
jgi:hypothetical protein